MLFDYTEAKNETAAKNQARKDLCNLFLEWLQEKFGEDGEVGLVGNNEIGFVCGTVIDKDGYTVNMVATVKPVIKNYQDHAGPKRDSEAFDFDESKRIHAEIQKEKAEKKKNG